MGSEWILGRLAWGGCELESTGSGQGPVVGCCECGDESSGSCATELVRTSKRTPHFIILKINWLMLFKFYPLKIVGTYNYQQALKGVAGTYSYD
jgi:hypothetical protein